MAEEKRKSTDRRKAQVPTEPDRRSSERRKKAAAKAEPQKGGRERRKDLRLRFVRLGKEESISEGIEFKIINIAKKLAKAYPDLGNYVLSYHKEDNPYTASYHLSLTNLDKEDIDTYYIRFSKRCRVEVPLKAIQDFDKEDFMEQWGASIYDTKEDA